MGLDQPSRIDFGWHLCKEYTENWTLVCASPPLAYLRLSSFNSSLYFRAFSIGSMSPRSTRRATDDEHPLIFSMVWSHHGAIRKDTHFIDIVRLSVFFGVFALGRCRWRSTRRVTDDDNTLIFTMVWRRHRIVNKHSLFIEILQPAVFFDAFS